MELRVDNSPMRLDTVACDIQSTLSMDNRYGLDMDWIGLSLNG